MVSVIFTGGIGERKILGKHFQPFEDVILYLKRSRSFYIEILYGNSCIVK